jgi:hypothetical protein
VGVKRGQNVVPFSGEERSSRQRQCAQKVAAAGLEVKGGGPARKKGSEPVVGCTGWEEKGRRPG